MKQANKHFISIYNTHQPVIITFLESSFSNPFVGLDASYDAVVPVRVSDFHPSAQIAILVFPFGELCYNSIDDGLVLVY